MSIDGKSNGFNEYKNLFLNEFKELKDEYKQIRNELKEGREIDQKNNEILASRLNQLELQLNNRINDLYVELAASDLKKLRNDVDNLNSWKNRLVGAAAVLQGQILIGLKMYWDRLTSN